MANPHSFAMLREKAGKSKRTLVRDTCECPVHFIINLLQIKQEQVGKRQQRFKHAEKRFVIGERLARRVDNGVHALFLCKAKQLRHEFELEQRLAAADRDTALLLPVWAIPPRHPKDLLGCRLVAALLLPCLRIVTVLTAVATPLHEDDEADARSINRAEALCRADSAFTYAHGRCAKSRPAAARASG